MAEAHDKAQARKMVGDTHRNCRCHWLVLQPAGQQRRRYQHARLAHAAGYYAGCRVVVAVVPRVSECTQAYRLPILVVTAGFDDSSILGSGAQPPLPYAILATL